MNDQQATIYLLIYLAIGLPVVWLHVKQQKMAESMRQIPNRTPVGLVIYTLAVMWPLLLLAIVLNYFQKPRPPKR